MERQYKTQIREMFNAHIKIKLPEGVDNSLFEYLFGILENTDKKYNSYRPCSYIRMINRYAGEYIEVDDEGIALLKRIIKLSRLFDGLYDVTVMPLIRLWGFYSARKSIPTPAEINHAKSDVDYRRIDIKGNRVKIDKGQEIITGSFIKAYAVDKVRDEIERLEINDGIINAGRSTISAINRLFHHKWRVMVRQPDTNTELFLLNIDNHTYSTSEQYANSVEIDGKRFGHIINPLTGYPVTNKQTGIITDNSLEGDIISTAVINETPENFESRIEKLSKYYPLEGFLIDENGKTMMTPGFCKYCEIKDNHSVYRI